MAYTKKNLKMLQAQRENINYSVRYEYPKTSESELMDIAEDIGVKMDEQTWNFIFINHLVTPRGLLNFINFFGKKTITFNNVIKEATRRIGKDEVKSKLLEFTFNIQDKAVENPVVMQTLRSFDSFKKLKDYIEIFEGRKSMILESIDRDLPRIATFSKKISHIKIETESIRFISDDWKKMDMYFNLLKTLRKKKDFYQGDMSLFIGWKGNMIGIYDAILGANVNMRDYVMMNLPDMTPVKNKSEGGYTMFSYRLLSDIYQDCFQEGGYLKEMMKRAKKIKRMEV
jgi:hypothetical protein